MPAAGLPRVHCRAVPVAVGRVLPPRRSGWDRATIRMQGVLSCLYLLPQFFFLHWLLIPSHPIPTRGLEVTLNVCLKLTLKVTLIQGLGPFHQENQSHWWPFGCAPRHFAGPLCVRLRPVGAENRGISCGAFRCVR